ncbi:unnamed protein product [Moneuplotes crassus]|uniref:Uncharacterized protein n=1 Tax=Euplotes crassus TaxID=5936 RepID=A0AAD1Y299_EUPCR|nr:unnamed protein product [Moneuplotes crassus]
MKGVKINLWTIVLFLILCISLNCLRMKRSTNVNHLEISDISEIRSRVEIGGESIGGTSQSQLPSRLQQVDMDDDDDDDFIDAMKGTISVSCITVFLIVILGFMIFKAAEWGNKASTEIKFRQEVLRKELIFNAREFLDRNGFVEKGLSPYYKN